MGPGPDPWKGAEGRLCTLLSLEVCCELWVSLSALGMLAMEQESRDVCQERLLRHFILLSCPWSCSSAFEGPSGFLAGLLISALYFFSEHVTSNASDSESSYRKCVELCSFLLFFSWELTEIQAYF